MRNLVVISAIALLLAACGTGGNRFSDFSRLPEQGWSYGDSVEFIPEIADSIAEGVLSVAVCHNNNYEYSNLWLEVSYPTGESRHRDTIELDLADDYGHWKGNGLGTTFQLERRLPGRIRLHRGTRVSVRHIMRVDTLRDIEQIGVTFNPE